MRKSRRVGLLAPLPCAIPQGDGSTPGLPKQKYGPIYTLHRGLCWSPVLSALHLLGRYVRWLRGIRGARPC